MDIRSTDVLNAYITALCHEKIWTTLGKSLAWITAKGHSGARTQWAEIDWCRLQVALGRVHASMQEMGYPSCPTDPDLWLKEQTDKKGRQTIPTSSVT